MLEDDKVEEVVTEVAEPVEADEAQAPEVETEADISVVTFGDEEAPEEEEEAAAWVKDVRKRSRELSKENADLKKQIEAGKADVKPVLGAAPTLEGCDYDEEKFSGAIRQYDAKKFELEAGERSQKEEAERQNKAYQEKLTAYNESRGQFDADSFDEAESNVKEALTPQQHAILVHAFGKNAAPLISGLGRDDKRLKELASIKDPIAYAVAATRLESSMKTSQRKPRTTPETRVTGDHSGGTPDKTLEKLEAEADRTGDRSKIVAHKRKLRLASK